MFCCHRQHDSHAETMRFWCFQLIMHQKWFLQLITKQHIFVVRNLSYIFKENSSPFFNYYQSRIISLYFIRKIHIKYIIEKRKISILETYSIMTHHKSCIAHVRSLVVVVYVSSLCCDFYSLCGKIKSFMFFYVQFNHSINVIHHQTRN